MTLVLNEAMVSFRVWGSSNAESIDWTVIFNVGYLRLDPFIHHTLQFVIILPGGKPLHITDRDKMMKF